MSDRGSAGEEQSKPSPEYLPLPVLSDSDSIAYDLTIAVTDARVQLYEALKVVWATCFPLDLRLGRGDTMRIRVKPSEFFLPFVTYGVQYYEAYAHALLALKPQFSEYEAWVNHALKTFISDELAPYRQDGKNYQQLSEWQSHMGATWRLFNHPQRSRLFAEAKVLMDALEDAGEAEWANFLDALLTGMSRRMLPLLAEGLKALRNTVQSEALDRPERAAQPTAVEERKTVAKREIARGSNRRAAVDAYIEEVFREKGKRITRTDIWKSARYRSRTEFERWERNDPDRPNRTADERFTQILIDKPHLK